MFINTKSGFSSSGIIMPSSSLMPISSMPSDIGLSGGIPASMKHIVVTSVMPALPSISLFLHNGSKSNEMMNWKAFGEHVHSGTPCGRAPLGASRATRAARMIDDFIMTISVFVGGSYYYAGICSRAVDDNLTPRLAERQLLQTVTKKRSSCIKTSLRPMTSSFVTGKDLNSAKK